MQDDPRDEGLSEAAIAEYRSRMQAEADRPEAFWRYQREAIAAQLISRRKTRWMWATAAAMVVLLAVLLTLPAQRQQAAQRPDPDHELLVEVERSLRREVPRALEPASLLTEELNRAMETRSNP